MQCAVFEFLYVHREQSAMTCRNIKHEAHSTVHSEPILNSYGRSLPSGSSCVLLPRWWPKEAQSKAVFFTNGILRDQYQYIAWRIEAKAHATSCAEQVQATGNPGKQGAKKMCVAKRSTFIPLKYCTELLRIAGQFKIGHSTSKLEFVNRSSRYH